MSVLIGRIRMQRRVVRERFLKLVSRSQSRLISIVAPAGFGKTTLAEAIAAEGGACLRCDAASIGTLGEFAVRLAGALASEPESETCRRDLIERVMGATSNELAVDIVLQAWESCDRESVLILDNLESIGKQPELVEFLARLVRTSRDRRLVLCSRPSFQLVNTRLIPPNEHLQFRHEDLAFNADEILQLFDHVIDSAQVDRILDRTQGWPVAVLLLLQCARLGQLDRALDGPGTAFDLMREYIANEVVGSLSDDLCESLLALLATRAGPPDGVFRASGGNATPASLLELTRELPLVRLCGDGRYSVHPLISSHFEATRGPQIDLYRETAARSLERDGLLEAAVPLYLDARCEEAAANCLELLVGSIFEANDFVAAYLDRVSVRTVRRYPKLWSLRVLGRLATVKPELLLAEGKLLRDDVRQRPESAIAGELDAILVMLATCACDFDYADRIVAEHVADADTSSPSDAALSIAVTVRNVSVGRTRGAVERFGRLAPFVHHRMLLGYARLRIEPIIAAMGGRFEDALIAHERALEQLRSCAPTELLEWLGWQRAVIAWLAGDDEVVDRAFDDIRREGYLARSPLYDALAAAWTDGSRSQLRADVPPRGRAYLLLLMAGRTLCPEVRLALVDEARDAANESHDLFAQVLVLVARALSEPPGSEGLDDALILAAEIGETGLTESIASLEQGGSGWPALAAFAQRFAPSSSRAKLTDSVIRVSALSCSIWRGNRRIALSKRALALILTLAVLRHVRSVDLLELLWGEDTIDSGTQALKMLVSRARAQLGDPGAIVASRGGYSLGDHVVVDFDETERLLRSLVPRDSLTDRERRELLMRYEQFKDSWSRISGVLSSSVEAVIATMRHRVIERLGRDALDRGDAAFAHDLANELRRFDPSDESAFELVVCAFLQTGDDASAMREYRRYSEHLMRHLGVRPAISLEDLISRNEGHAWRLRVAGCENVS